MKIKEINRAKGEEIADDLRLDNYPDDDIIEIAITILRFAFTWKITNPKDYEPVIVNVGFKGENER